MSWRKSKCGVHFLSTQTPTAMRYFSGKVYGYWVFWFTMIPCLDNSEHPTIRVRMTAFFKTWIYISLAVTFYLFCLPRISPCEGDCVCVSVPWLLSLFPSFYITLSLSYSEETLAWKAITLSLSLAEKHLSVAVVHLYFSCLSLWWVSSGPVRTKS